LEIIWPERYSIANTAVHVSNELEIPASADVIWAWLVRASLWPDWYPPIRAVTIEGGAKDLGAGSKFTYRIFGITPSSRVEEFIPCERLGWSTQYEGVDAYHAWLIEKKPEGCRVVVGENLNGWLARLNNRLRPSNTSYHHYIWLQALSKRATQGWPPGSMGS
jgi:Polyketide cyclase / dehydrase and lipid transport